MSKFGIGRNKSYRANDDRSFSCASRAALASSSSYRLQLYQEEPCGSHEPKHTQQKWCLQFWFLHTCEWKWTEKKKKNNHCNCFADVEFYLNCMGFPYHMIAATIFLDCDITFWTFFCICCNPIGCLWVIFTFFDPFFQKATQHRIVPILAAFKTKYVRTFACHRPRFHINHFDGISTIGRWTPTQQTITFHKTICD